MEKVIVEIITEVESASNNDNHVSVENEKGSENALAASDGKTKDDENHSETTNSEETAVDAKESDQQINGTSQVVQAQKVADDIIDGSGTHNVNITEEQTTSTQLNHEEEIFSPLEEADWASEKHEEIFNTSCGRCSLTTTITSASRSIQSAFRGDSSTTPGSGSGGQVH